MTWLLVLAAAAAGADPRAAVGLTEHLGARVPVELEFTDTTGNHLAFRDLLAPGRPVVLVLAYGHCRMLCSVVLRGVADAVATSALEPGRAYLPVVVTIDPRETVATAAGVQDGLLAAIHRPGERTRWPYLIGDPGAVPALAASLGFHYAWDDKTDQFAHPAVVFVLTPDGRIAEYLRGVQYPGLDDAIARAASGNLTSSVAQDILSCFHFDPSLRRYGWQMSLFLRLGALTVVVSLGSLIAGLYLWDRRRRRGR